MSYPMEKRLLTPSKWVRPQSKLKGVDGIVWHWVANPNSTAIGNRNFFNNRSGSYGSAHYIVGLQGEQIQCLPDDEIGYHVGSHVYTQKSLRELGAYPNNNTIGIECTHIDWDGKMTDDTYKSLIELTVRLLKKFKLTADDIWLHQEVVGWKDCHRYYVNNPSEYRKAKEDVAKKMNQTVKNPPKKVNPKKDIDVVRKDSKGDYTVQKGDTLWAIAEAFNTTVANLEKLNPKVKAKSLQVGAKIKVSGSASTSTKAKNTIAKPKVKLKVDGRWGKETTRALQVYLKTIVDGEISNQISNQATKAIVGGIKFGKGGSTVVKALQKHIGMKGSQVDGYLGSQTIKQLQKYLGMKHVDGVISTPSAVVKELQRRLNNGNL